MKENLKLLAVISAIALIAAAFLYIMAAGIAWKFRNPKANDTTKITHFTDMIMFRKLEKFQ